MKPTANPAAYNPAAWADIEPHLDHALELDPPQRAAWLADLDTTRPELARAVRSLLAECDALDAKGFLNDELFVQDEALPSALLEIVAQRAGDASSGASHDAHGDDSVDDHGFGADMVVGPYRLIRRIGYGGMSSVWLAQRSDGQMKRDVALKLPLLGPRMHMGRFMRERDLLAALTHPGIARLYDAGISEAGQPYLAMEYVAGAALIRSCDERRLTIHQRLRLFLQVLEAVQFAHAQLIIHRDLKPSNILVTPEDRVALLDFGIGKLLIEGTDQPHLTQVSGVALTPHYASPEQIAGRPLGIASDIYSLGVILYELLTGSRPYRPKRDSRAALEEAILTDDLRRPSQEEIPAQAAAARSTSTRALARTLAGDLDTIVLKALKKDPQRRYASITAFAQDITHHLRRLPVSARPDSRWYRIGRFVSRYRMPVAAASVALCALLSGAALALWQARVAAADRTRAVALAARNEAVTGFLGRVITEAAVSAKPVTVSDMLARSERLALSAARDSPENRAAVLEMIAGHYASLDDAERAAQLSERALALLTHSPDRALRSRLTCEHATAISHMGRRDEAARTIAGELRQLDADPETASHCLLNFAWVSWHAGRAQDALRYARQGLERARFASRPMGTAEASLLGAVAYGYHMNGRNEEADRYFEQALRKFGEIGYESSFDALATANNWAVMTCGAGMPLRALQLYDRIRSAETEREPGAQPTTLTAGNRARALQAVGRFEQARAEYEVECRLAEAIPGDTFNRAHCLLGLADLAVETRSVEAAADYLQRTSTVLGPALPHDSPPMLAMTLLRGKLDLAAGKFESARRQFDVVLATRTANSTVVGAALAKAETRLAEADAAAAVRDAQLALEMTRSLQGGLPYSNRTGLAWLLLGRALQQQGDAIRARQAFAAAVNHLSNTVDADHPALRQARQLYAAE